MKVNKTTSVEEYKLISTFERLRTKLLEDKYADRIERPLAYWALPSDRRLPLAFLGRSIRDLLQTPFEELSATAGIGQKKISSLVKLLARATKDQPPDEPFGLTDTTDEFQPAAGDGKRRPMHGQDFDPALVSEVLWSQWRDCVRKYDVGHETLGRLAPTLQALPTVIWHTPLETYLGYGVGEIRNLKTHGEKRVRVILEVFYVVHELLEAAGEVDHLVISLQPKFVAPIQRWLARRLDTAETPSREEVLESFVKPMIAQVLVDAGPTIAHLAEGRLGVGGSPQSVRQQARRMAVTRARVYQLLDECGKVMSVRWPEGRHLLASLVRHLEQVSAENDELQLLRSAIELFYPDHGDEDQPAG